MIDLEGFLGIYLVKYFYFIIVGFDVKKGELVMVLLKREFRFYFYVIEKKLIWIIYKFFIILL